jgi:hypothetical protein
MPTRVVTIFLIKFSVCAAPSTANAASGLITVATIPIAAIIRA